MANEKISNDEVRYTAMADAKMYVSDGMWDGDLEEAEGWATTAFEFLPDTGDGDWEIYWQSFQETLISCCCRYCHDDNGAPHPVRTLTVPALTDHEAWERVAREHSFDCEWLLTRAFRLLPE